MTCEEGGERSEKDIVLASRLPRWQGGKHERRRVPKVATHAFLPALRERKDHTCNRLRQGDDGSTSFMCQGSKTLLSYRIVQPTRPIRAQELTGPLGLH